MSMLGFIKRLFGFNTGTPTKSAASQRRGKPRLNARGGMRVLVVDDSITIVAVLRRMLEQNGYRVLEALDGEKGVEIANSELPDLIFLDIVLPGMSGFAALRQLRRESATHDIPIIMMSGNEQATEQFYAQKIGADDFMKKPFSRAEVFARIEGLLDTSLLPKRHGVRSADLSTVP
jgi:DNA-binding response OmpR family regulator